MSDFGWIALPQHFHPLDRAFIGKMRVRQHSQGLQMQGALPVEINNATLTAFKLGAPEVMPEINVTVQARDVKTQPAEFIGALIYRGDEPAALFFFHEGTGIPLGEQNLNSYVDGRLVPKIQKPMNQLILIGLAIISAWLIFFPAIMYWSLCLHGKYDAVPNNPADTRTYNDVLPPVFSILTNEMKNYMQGTSESQTPHV